MINKITRKYPKQNDFQTNKTDRQGIVNKTRMYSRKTLFSEFGLHITITVRAVAA